MNKHIRLVSDVDWVLGMGPTHRHAKQLMSLSPVQLKRKMACPYPSPQSISVQNSREILWHVAD